MSEYKACKRCVMDNKGDENISFDMYGNCNYCNAALAKKNHIYFPNEKGARLMKELVAMLKEKGKGKEYDCFMGLSGGLDSSYLAYIAASKYGLRILALHIDDGLDTEISRKNIEKLCTTANIKLITIKPDAEQFYDLTLSFIKASVPNIAIPQDNVLFSCIYKYMEENSVDYFLSGGNFALESILQSGNTHMAYDKKHILDIQKKFGNGSVDKLPIISLYYKDVVLTKKKNITTLCPLDYMEYRRDNALQELADYCGFEYYGAKHWESHFTKFMQTYYLYKKFNVDKRKSHLSSMIVSDQLTREEALIELSHLPYGETDIKKTLAFVADQLGISADELEQYVNQPPKRHRDYKTSTNIWVYPLALLRKIKKMCY